MLDRAADPGGDVDVRFDDLAGLADLALLLRVLFDVALELVGRGDDPAGDAEVGVLERVGEFEPELHPPGGVVADPAPERDDHLVAGEVDAALEAVVPLDRHAEPVVRERRVELDDLALALGVGLGHLEAPRDHRRPLRVELPVGRVETEDRRVLEPREVGTLHVEDALELLFVPRLAGLRGIRDDGLLDVQPRTVAREPAVELALHQRREVPSVVRRREQHVARFVVRPLVRVFVPLDRLPVDLLAPAELLGAGAGHLTEHLGVRLVVEPLQPGVLGVDRDVGAVLDRLLGEPLDLVADHHRHDAFVLVVPLVVVVHQLAGLPEHLPRDVDQGPPLGLAVDPHVAVDAALELLDVLLVGGGVVELGVLLLGREPFALLGLLAAPDRVELLFDQALRGLSVLTLLLLLEQHLQLVDVVDLPDQVAQVGDAVLAGIDVAGVLLFVLGLELLDPAHQERLHVLAVGAALLDLEHLLQFVEVLDPPDLRSEFSDVVVARVEFDHRQSPPAAARSPPSAYGTSSSRISSIPDSSSGSTIVASRSEGAFGIGSTPETMVGEPSSPM